MEKFKVPTLEEMLEAGVHFGHTTSRWHPKMEKYLYGKRSNIHIIDLVKTREHLELAAKFVKEQSSEGRIVLFVGVKPLARQTVKEAAIRCASPYCVNRWIGGTLTNWNAISGMIKRLHQIEDDKKTGKLGKYTKKEQLIFEEELIKLEAGVGGLSALLKKPDILFIIDAKYDKTAVNEAIKIKIPIIGIVDSNINPTKITYPIPANDDAIKSIHLITNAIADAVKSGKESRVEVEKNS